jgi:hypothetical protein
VHYSKNYFFLTCPKKNLSCLPRKIIYDYDLKIMKEQLKIMEDVMKMMEDVMKMKKNAMKMTNGQTLLLHLGTKHDSAQKLNRTPIQLTSCTKVIRMCKLFENTFLGPK